MSKAFTREDDLPDPGVTRRPLSSLPPGVSNYITPQGAERLRQELQQLVEVERPRLATSDKASARSEAVEQRIQYLRSTLQSAVIVNAAGENTDQVKFGATVTVRDSGGEESRYQIVGVDEIDIDQGKVSWLSPIAKALLNARVGDRVRLKLPARMEELEVMAIEHEGVR